MYLAVLHSSGETNISIHCILMLLTKSYNLTLAKLLSCLHLWNIHLKLSHRDFLYLAYLQGAHLYNLYDWEGVPKQSFRNDFLHFNNAILGMLRLPYRWRHSGNPSPSFTVLIIIADVGTLVLCGSVLSHNRIGHVATLKDGLLLGDHFVSTSCRLDGWNVWIENGSISKLFWRLREWRKANWWILG